MKENSIGLDFARTCNDHDSHMPKSRGDCFDYGQWYGCNTRCPVFADGECKLEDVDAFVKMIKEKGLDEKDLNEIKELYPALEGIT